MLPPRIRAKMVRRWVFEFSLASGKSEIFGGQSAQKTVPSLVLYEKDKECRLGSETKMVQRPQLEDPSFWAGLQVPELTGKGRELRDLARGIPKKAQVLAAKEHSRALWLVFLGGTGTGKSTLFNALSQKQVSRTGVERPKTLGAVAYAHVRAEVDKSLPAFLGPIHSVGATAASEGQSGQEQGLTLVVHQDSRLQNLVLVDTPDLDSLITGHQEMAHDILLMADAVLFVASQEKYADEVLYQALLSLGHSGQDLFFILNKVDPPAGKSSQDTLQEVTEALDPEHVFLDPNWCMALPFVPAGKFAEDDADMQTVSRMVMSHYASDAGLKMLARERKRTWADVQADLVRVDEILQSELREVAAWEKRLDRVFDQCLSRLMDREEAGFQARERQAVQEEIRKVFGRFDFLAGPRRVIGSCLRLPFRLLGIGGPSQQSRREDLEKAKSKADSRPIQEAVDEFNLRVLEDLLPASEDTAAGRALRQRDLAMTPEEVQARFRAVQEDMALWLNDRFERMAREAPRGKAWGIYSTSALWGVLIVSFETVVGGGLSLVEVLIDSAVAPYVTKGAVELFAYQELRSITRELSAKLKDGIVGIMQEQKGRYVQAIRDLGPDPQAMEAVHTWAAWSEKDTHKF